ncbi:MAG: cation-translocating P-type ATPase [Alphaproteobacteria bacterium]|nr:cation-translocating P-type ATPase [Alphaproteobacteria bacterium]
MRAKAVLAEIPGVSRVLLDKAGSVLVVQSSVPSGTLRRALDTAQLPAAVVRRSVGRRNLAVIDQAALALLVLVAQIVFARYGFGLAWPIPLMAQAAATVFVLLIPGASVLREAAAGLRRLRFSVEMTLVIGAGAAWTAGLLSSLHLRDAGQPYFLLGTLIVFCGLLAQAANRASQAISSEKVRNLLHLMPDDATVEGRNGLQRVRTATLQRGRVVVVGQGMRFPADGTIVEGAGPVDESTITGADAPQPYGPGDAVLAGTVNLGAPLRVKVTARPRNAVVGLLARLAAAEDSPRQAVVHGWLDRRLKWAYFGALVLAMIVVAVGIMAGPDWWGVPLEQGMLVAAAATPASLMLIGPTAYSVAALVLRRWGIWVRDPAAIDRVGQVTLLVARMSGVVTEGRRRVLKATAAGGGDERRILGLAAAAVEGSAFRWAGAVARAAIRSGVAETGLETRQVQQADGVVADVQQSGRSHRVATGTAAFLAAQGVRIHPNFLHGDLPGELAAEPMYVVVDGRAAGVIWLTEPIRLTARRALLDLRANGVETCLMSDRDVHELEQIAATVASDSYVIAETDEQQVAEIAAMRESGHVVAMTGHPVRDGAALAAADVSIGFGILDSPAAARTGFLVRDESPLLLSACFAAARVTKRRLWQSAVLATVPMLAAVVLAVMGRLDVWIALILLGVGVGLVMLNGLRMLYWRPRFSDGMG